MGFLACIEFKCPVTDILYCEKTNDPEYLLCCVYGLQGDLKEFITNQLIFDNKKPECPPILPLPPLPLPLP
jgi:hypothetical protein